MTIKEIIKKITSTRENPKEDDGIFLCPFHTEKTPSFTVRAGRFHCFGCGKDGGVSEFIALTKDQQIDELLAKTKSNDECIDIVGIEDFSSDLRHHIEISSDRSITLVSNNLEAGYPTLRKNIDKTDGIQGLIISAVSHELELWKLFFKGLIKCQN